MGKFKDLTGQVFGRLTVLERDTTRKGKIRWICRCECGKIKSVRREHLTSGATKSCGCFSRETTKIVNTKHDLSRTKAYRTWLGMKTRCLNPKSKKYKNYGGRGITICAEWKDDFAAFFAYVSKLEHFGEDGYSLDRIDNNGNYEPGNVRWADKKTQLRNTRNNVIVEYEGEKMILTDAAKASGINFDTLRRRIKHGDTGEQLFRPVKQGRRNGNIESGKGAGN